MDSHGFKLVNSSGTFLVDSTDPNEVLYLLRDASDGSGLITGATNDDMSTKTITLGSSLEDSLVFIRPSDRTVTRRLLVSTEGSQIKVTLDGGTDVEYMVFDKATDLTASALEAGYGINVYTEDENIHWSSNTLNARVKTVLEGNGASYSLSGGWTSCLNLFYSKTYTQTGPAVDSQARHTTTGYMPQWNTDGTIQIKQDVIGISVYDTKGGSYSYTYTLDTHPKMLVADLGDRM